jgi:hypothetical protein
LQLAEEAVDHRPLDLLKQVELMELAEQLKVIKFLEVSNL